MCSLGTIGLCGGVSAILSGPIEIQKRGITADDRSVVWVVLAVFMRKEPTRVGSGSTFNDGSVGYTAVFMARLLKTGSTKYGTMSINN